MLLVRPGDVIGSNAVLLISPKRPPTRSQQTRTMTVGLRRDAPRPTRGCHRLQHRLADIAESPSDDEPANPDDDSGTPSRRSLSDQGMSSAPTPCRSIAISYLGFVFRLKTAAKSSRSHAPSVARKYSWGARSYIILPASELWRTPGAAGGCSSGQNRFGFTNSAENEDNYGVESNDFKWMMRR